jgi:hypothetical protein
MSLKNIIITDILELEDIDKNTPILIIKNIPSSYLIKVYNNIYWVDTSKLYSRLKHKLKYIDNFIPVGQIKTNKKNFTSIFANSKLIPTTKSFDKIKNNEWVAIIKKNGKINRSISSIKSIKKPDIHIPVFPINLIQKYTDTSYNKSVYRDIYSHKSFGRWILNRYMFNIDKSSLKMIDSTGNISSMFIPDSNINLFKNNSLDNIFFTTQGNTSNNNNDIIPNDNDNISLNNYDVVYNNKIKRKKLVLREKDNPWFLDSDIVGDVVNTENPHKVTGMSLSETYINDIDNLTDNIDTHNNSVIFIICFLILIFFLLRIIKTK